MSSKTKVTNNSNGLLLLPGLPALLPGVSAVVSGTPESIAAPYGGLAALGAQVLFEDVTGHAGSSSSPLVKSGAVPVFNVKDFGAKGDPTKSADDAAAIQATIDAAIAAGGGIVYLPSGTYPIRSTLTVPPQVSYNIEIRGEHVRNVRITVDAALSVAVLWGDTTRDVYVSMQPPTSDHDTLYGRISDLTITANAVAAGCTMLKVVEAQSFELHSVNIEEATTGIGLLLQGSDTSAAGKAGAANPHCWRGKYSNVGVYHCRQPLVLDNADENDFIGCNFGVDVVGVVAGRTAVRIKQGRNNRFFSTLVEGAGAGNTSVGVLLDSLTTGPVEGNQFYGLVCEGFDTGVVINHKDATGTVLMGYNSSLNNAGFTNVSGANGTMVSQFNDVDFYGRLPISRYTDIPWNATCTFDARGGNQFRIDVNSASAWTLDITAPKDGQEVMVEFYNSTGGAVTAPTSSSITLCATALTMPAASKRRLIGLVYSGATWRETWRSLADQN